MAQERIHPTLEELGFYKRLCDAVRLNPSKSFRSFAKDERRSESSVHLCLGLLETVVGSTLIQCSNRKSPKQITRKGEEFYKYATRVLDEHGRLNDLVQGEVETLRIGTTNALLLNFLPRPTSVFMKAMRECGKNVRLTFHEYEHEDIVRDLQSERIDFGFGPAFPADRHGDIQIEPFDRPLELVIVCDLKHRFARERRESVSLDELATERVLMRRPGLQPAFAGDQLGHKNGQRVEMTNYISIVACAAMGVGVGVVPGWYWLLDDLRKQGHLYFAHVPELGTINCAAYLPAGGQDQLTDVGRAFIQAVREFVPRMKLQSAWTGKAMASAARFPRSLRRYKFLYYVTCAAAGFEKPCWEKSTLTWLRHSGAIDGWEKDRQKKVRKFRLRGHLLPNLMYYHAKGHELREGERHVAVFNTVTAGVLIGTWTGTDRHFAPMSAPVVLARTELDGQSLWHITDNAMLRFVQNADPEQ